MPTTKTIDGEFVKGVFRPLKPVVLPERYPSKIIYDEPPATAEIPTPEVPDQPEIPRHQAPVYPEVYPDLGEDTYEYVSPPPKFVRTVMVKFEYVGKHQPPHYPEEE